LYPTPIKKHILNFDVVQIINLHNGSRPSADVETQLKYATKYIIHLNCFYCFKFFCGVYLEFGNDAEFNCVVAADVNTYMENAVEFARLADFVAYSKYLPLAYAVGRSVGP
jgi:hypothetical protein